MAWFRQGLSRQISVLSRCCCAREWESAGSCLASLQAGVMYTQPTQQVVQWPARPQQRPFGRGFAAEPVTQPSSQEKVAAANAVLQHLNVTRFREQLESEGQLVLHISYRDLLQKCLDSGAAVSLADAERVCEALNTSGNILRFKSTVYLRPEEVADVLMQALPEHQAEIEEQLAQMEAELAPLQKEKEFIDASSTRRFHFVQWLGLGFLITQFALFVRLTYWELSWDVMEPLAFFVSLVFTIAGYLYFMFTRQDFAYRSWMDRLKGTWQDRMANKKNFNRRRHERLVKEVARLKKHLIHIRG